MSEERFVPERGRAGAGRKGPLRGEVWVTGRKGRGAGGERRAARRRGAQPALERGRRGWRVEDQEVGDAVQKGGAVGAGECGGCEGGGENVRRRRWKRRRRRWRRGATDICSPPA